MLFTCQICRINDVKSTFSRNLFRFLPKIVPERTTIPVSLKKLRTSASTSNQLQSNLEYRNLPPEWSCERKCNTYNTWSIFNDEIAQDHNYRRQVIVQLLLKISTTELNASSSVIPRWKHILWKIKNIIESHNGNKTVIEMFKEDWQSCVALVRVISIMKSKGIISLLIRRAMLNWYHSKDSIIISDWNLIKGKDVLFNNSIYPVLHSVKSIE